MRFLGKHPWSKTGLLLGVLAGIGVVNMVDKAFSNVAVLDVWQAQNQVAAIAEATRGLKVQTDRKLLPRSGSVLDSTEIFSWGLIPGARDFRLLLGSYKAGSDIADVKAGNNDMVVVEGIPQDGSQVFLRLLYKIRGTEQYFDATYETLALLEDEAVISTDNPFNPPPKKKK